MRVFASLVGTAVAAVAWMSILALPPAPAHASWDKGNEYGYRCSDNNVSKKSRVRTYMIGDSLTYWGTPALRKLRPNWYIEGVPGRQASCLTTQVEGLLEVDAAPRMVVIALGTNASMSPDYKTVYRDSVSLLPRKTRVLLVTPFRAPSWNQRATQPRNKAVHQYHYARAMNALANERPLTCLAPWRYKASRHPSLLVDGIHATVPGRKVWAQLVARAERGCSR